MLDNFRNGRWFIASAFIVASCSQGDASRPTSPSAAVTTAPNGAGITGTLAAGDVKSGPGALVIDDVRMDRQTPSGASILRQYANPGGEYPIKVGETIELWVEWDRNIGKIPAGTLPTNPRFKVDWGEGESERFDFINCGSCLLRHTYQREGRFTVVVTLDDRVNTTVTRTFFLYTTADFACGAPANTTLLSTDFDDSESKELGPVDGANALSFSYTPLPFLSAQTTGEVRASGEGSCPGGYGHSHGGDVTFFVDVHNPDTGAWTEIFSQFETAGNEYCFVGTIGFPRQKVDRVRLRSNPGQGNSYHGWGQTSLTVSCSP